MHGPDQEVYFPQEYPPRREVRFDFAHGSSLKVTIAGQPYRHQRFQLLLSHSGWRYAELAAGETFRALQHGGQAALWTLGDVRLVVRSDNAAALTREMLRSGGRALNDAHADLLDHYGLRSARVNRDASHENGVAEPAYCRLREKRQAGIFPAQRQRSAAPEETGDNLCPLTKSRDDSIANGSSPTCYWRQSQENSRIP